MRNYWILQANPEKYFIVHWFLDEFLKKNPDYEDWWEVSKNDDPEVEDIVYIWKARYDPKKADSSQEYLDWKSRRNWKAGNRGIYAVGEITHGAQVEAITGERTERIRKYHVGDTWRSRPATLGPKIKFKYTHNLIDDPLVWDESLRRLFPLIWEEFAKPGAGQGKPAFKLTLEEGKALSQLLAGSP